MDGRTDGHLRRTLLGRLVGVDLKMETRHPVDGSFSSEFSASVIIAELKISGNSLPNDPHIPYGMSSYQL